MVRILIVLLVLLGCNDDKLIEKRKDYFLNEWKDKSWTTGLGYMKIFKKSNDEMPIGLCLGWDSTGHLIEIVYYKNGLPFNGCKHLPINDSKSIKIIQDQDTPYYVEIFENGKLIKTTELKGEISEYIEKFILPNYQAELDELKNTFNIKNILDLNK